MSPKMGPKMRPKNGTRKWDPKVGTFETKYGLKKWEPEKIIKKPNIFICPIGTGPLQLDGLPERARVPDGKTALVDTCLEPWLETKQNHCTSRYQPEKKAPHPRTVVLTHLCSS